MGAACSNQCQLRTLSFLHEEQSRTIQTNNPCAEEDCNSNDDDNVSTNFPVSQNHTFLTRLKYNETTNYFKIFCVDDNEEDVHSCQSLEHIKGTYKRLLSLQEFSPGVCYEGETVEGKRHGRGKQIWNNGTMYEGEFYDDKAKGKGKLIHKEGDYYEGDWENDKANGLGIYVNINGAKYEGEWKDDKQNGEGLEVWPDGSKYKGKYVMGRKTGKGCLYFWKNYCFICNF